MADFINTIDLWGDEETLDMILEEAITEFNDDTLTIIGAYAFFESPLLKKVKLPSVTTVVGNAFGRCTSLEIVDLSSKADIHNYAFYVCYNLKALILRSSEGIGNVGGLNFNTDKMYIYVPRALLESCKENTAWANWKDRFRALEDYTVDGTITGELDESKI